MWLVNHFSFDWINVNSFNFEARFQFAHWITLMGDIYSTSRITQTKCYNYSMHRQLNIWNGFPGRFQFIVNKIKFLTTIAALFFFFFVVSGGKCFCWHFNLTFGDCSLQQSNECEWNWYTVLRDRKTSKTFQTNLRSNVKLAIDALHYGKLNTILIQKKRFF